MDPYYGQYKDKFPAGVEIEKRLKNYWNWILKALPNLKSTSYRKPVRLYSLIGALDEVSGQGRNLKRISAERAGQRLLEFEEKTKLKEPPSEAARYVAAASRQTDNLIPRTTRIEILVAHLKA